ncbi:hypothetical protein D0962_23030 [Leptolyngbyaceae cyanobacterium CCMR0082]|uniref:Uncharacterized protein n=1 Tax=Adonisia turfae CCMR0082 TaxID=2304604 RepID=A0A6M0SAV5_9CYAN|nr:hypothetical protein [Adonisia turfae]NEZ65594.1 hypothetical protein [Adonisia turfae CCMR0082]
MTDLAQISQRAIAACEAEAVAWEYAPEAGREIFEGICRDHLERWTDAQYLQWSHQLSDKYGLDVIRLYKEINQVVYSRYYRLALSYVAGGYV